MSTALTHRHDGKTNMSYFGTGETFLFKLSPNCVAYHWNQQELANKPIKKTSTYVFIDTKPLMRDDAADSTTITKTKTAKKSRKASMKQSFSRKLSFAGGSKPSFNRSVSRSAYTKRDRISISLHPLSIINNKISTFSVSKHLYLNNQPKPKAVVNRAQTIDVGDIKKLKKTSCFEIIDDEDGLKQTSKPRGQSEYGGAKPKLKKTKVVDDDFEVIEEEGPPPTVGGLSITGTSNNESGAGASKRMELFISCDNNQIIVGGG